MFGRRFYTIPLGMMFVLSILLVGVFACPVFASVEDIIRIAIMPFDSSTPYASPQDVASANDIFTDVMVKTRSISVIERRRIEDVSREQRLSLSGMIDPGSAVRIGKLLGCQYFIQGSITNLSMGNLESSSSKSSTTYTLKGSATIHARVTDTTTGEVVWADSITQEIKERSTESHGKNYSSTSRPSANVVRQKAITIATRHLANKIREQLVGEMGQVIAVNGKNIRVNKGALLGVYIGDLYLIYGDGEAIRDIDGSILDREKLNVAVLQITKTFDNYSEGIIFGTASKATGGLLDVALVPLSLASAILGADAKPAGKLECIHVGDKMKYVTPEEARDMVKKKSFVSSRPKEPKKPQYSAEVQEALDSLENNEQAAQTGGASSNNLENHSTEPEKVISTYGLSDGEKRSRIALHNNLLKEIKRNPKSKNAYDRYVEMAQSYAGDYLAAYQAGLIAKAQGNKNYASYWFKKSLEANPNFEPAKDAQQALDSSPGPAKKEQC